MAAAWALVCFVVPGARAAAPPVVPGYHRLKDEAKAPPAALGELLVSELNCTACHAPPGGGAARVPPKGAPDLAGVGSRVTPQWLRSYLSDPHAAKPGATMPDVFHASEPEAKRGAVDFLVHYLVSLDGPIKPASRGGNTLLVEQGRTIYHTVGCVACHGPAEKAVSTKVPQVPLPNLAAKTTVDKLTAFLFDPLKTRPHGRMPPTNLTVAEAEAVAVYLLRAQIDNPQSKNAQPAREPGVAFAYYEGDRTNTASLERLEKLTAKAEGKAPKFTIKVPQRKSDDGFAFRFSGALKVPRDGKYTFFTTSDDGSRLYIDGKQVVDNDGTHGAEQESGNVELKAGERQIVVTYFEGGGGEELKVEWEGPGINRQEIPTDALFSVGGRSMVPLDTEPFTVDPHKAEMGKKMFALLGCASCHNLPDVTSQRPAKQLAALNLDSREGCLSEHVRKGLPQYHLASDQRDAIRVALKDVPRLTTPCEPQEVVTRTMAAFNCYACHRRGDAGGSPQELGEYFTMTASFDMGDEGRLPPLLSGAGTRLKPAAIERIVSAGELHVRRHHMATRMPRFPKEAARALAEALPKADNAPAESGPAFTETAVRDGRLLVGTKGMGCVNCHGIGAAKSLGMPSVDLAQEYERLTYDWFRRLLLDPAKVNPGTRMPAFWMDDHVVYKDVAGGTPEGQVAAIWSYMSLGKSMPLPAGVRPEGAGYELIPIEEPIVHRTFMAEIGPRAILVGYPDNLHVAFDANVVRLAKAWKGRFFDAKGMWDGRGGAHLAPLGTDVMNFPPGPALAVLPSPDAPWPIPKDRRQRNVGGEFKGYRLDQQQQPVFLYRVNGVEVEEQAAPVLKDGGVVLVRRFRLKSNNAPQGLHLLVAAGAKVEEKSPGMWIVDDKLKVRVSAKGMTPRLREVDGRKQVVVPVTFDNGVAALEVETSW